MSSHRNASLELASRDPVIAQLFERHGPMPAPSRVPVAARFETLARTIAHQQLAGRAAATIWGRVRACVEGPFTPEALLSVEVGELRAAGLSGAKVTSVLDLATAATDGRLQLDRLGRLPDDEVIEQLVVVRGIGPWSAQMFLMHALARLDVWPAGDLGVQVGYARAHHLDRPPTARDLEALGERFRPFRSVAAQYFWRSADDPEG